MIRHWTEADIRRVLDGTFTRVTYEGKVITENVEPDFIPYIGNKSGRPKGYSKPQLHWTPTEDEILWQMRLRNRQFSEIAWIVNRSVDATKKRYKILRVKGAVMV